MAMNQKQRLILYLLLAVITVFAIAWFIRHDETHTVVKYETPHIDLKNLPHGQLPPLTEAQKQMLKNKYCPVCPDANGTCNCPSLPKIPAYPSKEQLSKEVMNYLSKINLPSKPSKDQVNATVNYLKGKYCPADTSNSGSTPKNEVFWVGSTIYQDGMASAPSVCAAYGANLATAQQITDAYNNNASWCTAGVYADDPTKVYIPLNNITQCSVYGEPALYNWPFSSSGEPGVLCYGVKPSAQDVNPGEGLGQIAYFNDADYVWSMYDYQ